MIKKLRYDDESLVFSSVGNNCSSSSMYEAIHTSANEFHTRTTYKTMIIQGKYRWVITDSVVNVAQRNQSSEKASAKVSEILQDV